MDALIRISHLLKEKDEEIKALNEQISVLNTDNIHNVSALKQREDLILKLTEILSQIKIRNTKILLRDNKLTNKIENLNLKSFNIERDLKKKENEYKILCDHSDEKRDDMMHQEHQKKTEIELFNKEKEIFKLKIDTLKQMKRVEIENKNQKIQQLITIKNEMMQKTQIAIDSIKQNGDLEKANLLDKVRKLKSENENLLTEQILLKNKMNSKLYVSQMELEKSKKNFDVDSKAINEEYTSKIKLLSTQKKVKYLKFKDLSNRLCDIENSIHNHQINVKESEEKQFNFSRSLKRKALKFSEEYKTQKDNIQKLKNVLNILLVEKEGIETYMKEINDEKNENMKKFQEIQGMLNDYSNKLKQKYKKEEERTSNMRNKLLQADSILQNLELKMIDMNFKSKCHAADLLYHHSIYESKKKEIRSLKEKASKLEMQIHNDKVQKEYLKRMPKPPTEIIPGIEDFRIDSSDNEDNNIKFPSELSSLGNSLEIFAKGSSKIPEMRNKVSEIKSLYEEFSRQVHIQKEINRKLTSLDSELSLLTIKNQELKAKTEEMNQINKEIADIRSLLSNN